MTCLLDKGGWFDGDGRLGEWLPFANTDRTFGPDVLPPSSFHSFLLAGRGDPGGCGAVAPRAGGDEILQARGAAFGPGIEMVAVLSGPGTTTAEPHFHLTLAVSTRHAITALLAREAPDRIPTSDVACADDGRCNGQDDGTSAGCCDCGEDGVEHSAKYACDGGSAGAGAPLVFGMSARTTETLNHTMTAA